MAPHDDKPDNESNQSAESSPPADVTRRDFFKTVGAAGVAASVAQPSAAQRGAAQAPQDSPRAPVERPYSPIRQEVSENLVKRGIVGYADHLRIQPGETIKFMVSSETPRYRADIVRLIHGDAN